MTPNPLVLSQWSSEDLWLSSQPKLIVGYDRDGHPIPFDVFDFHRWGRPWLPQAGGSMTWTANTNRSSTAELRGMYPFHSGAMISPAVRRIIEEVGAIDVEFIPLRIVNRETGILLDDEWWFVNVFRWKDIFDFAKSRFEYREMPRRIDGSNSVSARFGAVSITEIYDLAVRPQAYTDGLFLARATTEKIWSRVFIGHELALRINEGVPPERQVYFEPFLVQNIPQPPKVQTALQDPAPVWKWPAHNPRWLWRRAQRKLRSELARWEACASAETM